MRYGTKDLHKLFFVLPPASCLLPPASCLKTSDFVPHAEENCCNELPLQKSCNFAKQIILPIKQQYKATQSPLHGQRLPRLDRPSPLPQRV